MTGTAMLLWLLATTPPTPGGYGWGCRTCDYSNGPELTGLRNTAAFAAPVVSQGTSTTVTLRSGNIIGSE
jgi:hypothetical protein